MPHNDIGACDPNSLNSREVSPYRTATATVAPAIGNSGVGPMCRTSTPLTTTDSGNVPKAHRMIALITRPIMEGGTSRCATVRNTVLPSPLAAPITNSAPAAPASPPR